MEVSQIWGRNMEMSGTQKAELRKTIREQFRHVSSAEKQAWDAMLCERVCTMPEVRAAGCIYAYASLPNEAGTWGIMERLLLEGHRLALPRVEGNTMEFYYIEALTELAEGSFHIMEPSAGRQDSRKVDRLAGAGCGPKKAAEPDALMLIPGTAFTADGLRLGKGGGFYDRFLSLEPGHPKIALAYPFQIVETLPSEEHDRKMDRIVTPDGSFRCGAGEERHQAHLAVHRN